jgi:hypothetical protein
MPTAYSIKKYFTLEISRNIAKPAATFRCPPFRKLQRFSLDFSV